MVNLQSSLNEYLKGKNNIQSRLINDTIYNHIEYTKLEDKILQSKTLNRLQFITQNALAYFSYPSITTKRFIHSLGTMHLSSYMLKNALLNANKQTKNSFLKQLKEVIIQMIEEDNLDIPIGGEVSYFDNKALYQFAIPTKNKAQHDTYTIILQALRLAGLLHDIGHLPFSHQVEYALKQLYSDICEEPHIKQKQKEFKEIYEQTTKRNTEVLHEAIGEHLIDILFEYELPELIQKQTNQNYIKLIHKLIKAIMNESSYGGFDFKVLHDIISGTVDADRLDYINRDMVSSGYIGAPNDHLRITKHTVLVQQNDQFLISFFDMGLIDIEHLLEMRFNLYKKIIFNYAIAKTDALLENVVLYLSHTYFENGIFYERNSTDSIAMLWNFLKENTHEEKLDIISMLDENWLISLFKREYFNIKTKAHLTQRDKKYLLCFEEVLFGKRFFKSPWKNLNEFYKTLEFSTIERYKFRESFGYITHNKKVQLTKALDSFVKKYEKEDKETFFSYQIVSFNLGIDKEFTLYDGESLISIDEVSTLRKRLKQSMQNTVPFYLYSNNKQLTKEMKKELKSIIIKTFTQ